MTFALENSRNKTEHYKLEKVINKMKKKIYPSMREAIKRLKEGHSKGICPITGKPFTKNMMPETRHYPSGPLSGGWDRGIFCSECGECLESHGCLRF